MAIPLELSFFIYIFVMNLKKGEIIMVNYVDLLVKMIKEFGSTISIKSKTVKGHLEESFITTARVIENDQLVFDVVSSQGAYLIYGERVEKYAKEVFENLNVK